MIPDHSMEGPFSAVVIPIPWSDGGNSPLPVRSVHDGVKFIHPRFAHGGGRHNRTDDLPFVKQLSHARLAGHGDKYA